MRKIIYRGPEQILRYTTSTKTVYSFEASNQFTCEALTWADYYELITLDPTHKILVDAEDPLAATNLRRRTMFEYEVPKEVYVKQEENEKKEKLVKQRALYIDQYKKRIIDQIASGTLEAFPESYDADAEKFADEMMEKLVAPIESKPVEETPVEDEVLPVDEVPEEETPEEPVEPTDEISTEEPSTEVPEEETPVEEEIPEEPTPAKKGKK